jgi:hypothetical protein
VSQAAATGAIVLLLATGAAGVALASGRRQRAG